MDVIMLVHERPGMVHLMHNPLNTALSLFYILIRIIPTKSKQILSVKRFQTFRCL